MQEKNKKHEEYQYLDLMEDILENGVKQVDKGTGAVTHSVFGRQIRFDLSQGFPLLTTKEVFWKGVLFELHWFLSGQSNIRYLVENNVGIWNDYPYKIYLEKQSKRKNLLKLTKKAFIEKIKTDKRFADTYGELPKIYGELWRRWPAKNGRTVDQVRWIVEEMKKDPDCHNTLVNSWNPEYLYDMAMPKEACRFPICHNMFQVNVKNKKLSLQLYQRSADIFLGVPFNIASYALLAHILAKVTGNEVGEFIHTFGDVHIYANHMDQVKEQLKRKPFPFPKISLDDVVRDIDDFLPQYAHLEGYIAHKAIRAELSPAGGVSTKDFKKNWKKYTK
ncbi:MAG: thymidylate synthase [Candidatus Moraniibacteriota bacterium]|nr:MAG: thymidylate synthase [Candidatus Moranbacteria bacterium]